MATCNNEVLSESTDESADIEYVDIGNVNSSGVITGTELLRFKAAPSRDRRKVRNGDVIVSTVRTYLRAIARIENPAFNLVVSTGFAVVRPTEEVYNRYLGYALQSKDFVDEVVTQSTGVSYPAITASELMKIAAPAPPTDEQRKIADFLDRETEKIDALIAEKEKLISLLEEKRKAVISEAVTKGLNPDVKMRDSGVPWLGMIPEHWRVKRLKFLVAQRLSYGANAAGDAALIDGVRFVRITDIDERGELRDGDAKFLLAEDAAPYQLRDGDILLARSGATVGKSFKYAPSWGRCCFAGYLICCRPKESLITSSFLYFFTKSGAYDMWKVSVIIKATIENISAERYANLIVPVPPMEEQETIMDHIEAINSTVNRATDGIEAQVRLLRERRAALIAAAVTGRIDVREEAS